MLRPLVAIAVALVLSAPAAAAERPSPAAALGQLVRAAGAGDAGRMWPLLSAGAQHRLGPLTRFRRGTAVELAEGLGSYARGSFRTALSQQIDTGVTVVAIVGTRRVEGRRETSAFAVAMRREHGRWRADLLSPVHVTPIGPSEGGHVGRVLQVAAGVVAPVRIIDGGLWVDGVAIAGKSGGTDLRHITFYGQPPRPLGRGRHVAVAVATAGQETGAVAWTFVID